MGTFSMTSRAETPGGKSDAGAPAGIYGTLPKSLRAEMRVRSRMEDPEVCKERQNLVNSKSVGELAAISGPSDIPIPTGLTNLFTKKPRSPSAPDEEDK